MKIKDCEAMVVMCSNGGDEFFGFTVDNPHYTRLWVSDEVDPQLVKKIEKGMTIKYSADEDDEGDMLITELEIVNG